MSQMGVSMLIGFALTAMAFADTFGGVNYTAPAGWKIDKTEEAIAFSTGTNDANEAMAIALGKSSDLGGKPMADWFAAQLISELANGKLLNESEVVKSGPGNAQKLTTVRVIEAGGATTLRFYCAVTDGKRAAMAIAMCLTEKAANTHSAAIKSFFDSLSFGSTTPPSKPTSKGEKVPESGFVNGVPRGIFVGTSLLSGGAICLMFLDGGRITRTIPGQDLDNFSWSEHLGKYPRNCGTYTISNGILKVKWGDGGVHEGPIKQTANGLEFYQKRYTKPEAVTVAQIAGRWESARSIGAIATTHDLRIAADGSFTWKTDRGGVVAGRAVYSSVRDTKGKLSIRGTIIVFRNDDGTSETLTFLRVPGNPIKAFSIGMDMFTKSDQ